MEVSFVYNFFLEKCLQLLCWSRYCLLSRDIHGLNEQLLWNCINVNELHARNKHKLWNFSNYNEIRIHEHLTVVNVVELNLIRKGTSNNSASLIKYSRRVRACYEEGVPDVKAMTEWRFTQHICVTWQHSWIIKASLTKFLSVSRFKSRSCCLRVFEVKFILQKNETWQCFTCKWI